MVRPLDRRLPESPGRTGRRVRVWWGDNEEENDQVELTTHIINPTGVVTEGGFSGLGAGGAAAAGGEQ